MTNDSQPGFETDHEFRLRMAAEGKAIYVPGKTAAQIEEAKRLRAKRYPVAMMLSEADVDDVLKGIDQLEFHFVMLEATLHLLSNDLLEDQPGLASVCHFTSIALDDIQKTHLGNIVDLRIALAKAWQDTKDPAAQKVQEDENQ